MGRIGTYAFLNAKVRAMRSGLLNGPVYQRLAAAQTLQELLRVLSETQYQHLADSGKFKELNLIERALFYEEVRRIRVIEKHSEGDVRQFISLFLERYEGERLKVLLRCWHRKLGPGADVLREKILFDVPVDAVLSAARLDEVVSLLECTPFREALERAEAAYSEEESVFPLELAVDRAVFGRLWGAVESFGREDRRIAGRLVGLEVDLKNLEWVGRFREYYRIAQGQIVDFLLPRGFRLTTDRLRQVAAGESVDDALRDVVRGSRIRLPEAETGRTLELLEGLLHHVLLAEARRAFGMFPFSIGAVMGYLTLVRIEIRNIRTLFQAKAYGLSPQETEALLIM